MRFNRNFRGRGINSQRTTAQRAIALLRALGTSAHVWLPGANGTTVASLPSNNYLLSDGSTGYSTVDGVVGLGLDGMGALSSTEKVTNGTFDTATTGWSSVDTIAVVSGELEVSGAGATKWGYQGISTVVGTTYQLGGTRRGGTGSAIVWVGTSQGNNNLGATSTTTTGNTASNSLFFTATTTTTYISLIATGAGLTAYFDNISVKEYTGTHLTQPTTANKPLVRRGAYNLLTYSNDLTNAAWTKSAATVALSAVASPVGGYWAKIIESATTSGHYITQIITKPIASAPWDASIYVAAGTRTWAVVEFADTNGYAFTYIDLSTGVLGTNGASLAAPVYRVTAVSGGWRVDISVVSASVSGSVAVFTAIGDGVGTYAGDGVSYVLAAGGQLAEGTTVSDYTPTTTTAASNPTSGKYWWSFDGSNDSLLSGNLGITNACTIVVAGRVNSLAATRVFLAESTGGVQFYVLANGQAFLEKNGTSALVSTSVGAIVAGEPFVLTCRLSGGTAVIRKNGVQIASTAAAVSFAATTGARIGTTFAGGAPFNGALGWVVPIAAALSDADCLTVERLVGSQFPGMATF